MVLAILLWTETSENGKQNDTNHTEGPGDEDEIDSVELSLFDSYFSLFTSARMLSGALLTYQLVNIDREGQIRRNVFSEMSIIALWFGGCCGLFELRKSPWIGLWDIIKFGSLLCMVREESNGESK